MTFSVRKSMTLIHLVYNWLQQLYDPSFHPCVRTHENQSARGGIRIYNSRPCVQKPQECSRITSRCTIFYHRHREVSPHLCNGLSVNPEVGVDTICHVPVFVGNGSHLFG